MRRLLENYREAELRIKADTATGHEKRGERFRIWKRESTIAMDNGNVRKRSSGG